MSTRSPLEMWCDRGVICRKVYQRVKDMNLTWPQSSEAQEAEKNEEEREDELEVINSQTEETQVSLCVCVCCEATWWNKSHCSFSRSLCCSQVRRKERKQTWRWTMTLRSCWPV